jgi:hypothetical protein
MKSIQIKFDKISTKNPNLSSYSCFAKAICGERLNRQTIHRWFYKLVDREDYDSKNKKGLFDHLEGLSNPSVDDKK